MLINMADTSWDKFADPAWADRLSLHEMQLQDGLEVAFEVAEHRQRHTPLLPSIVTLAISNVIPVGEVTNRELAQILFGDAAEDAKRSIRQLRNEKRPLRLDTATRYIRDLLLAKKITPGDAGRLRCIALVYHSAREVVTDLCRDNEGVDLAAFEENKSRLIAAACNCFAWTLTEELTASSELPLDGYPQNRLQQMMDYYAFIRWQEAKVKRNPMVAIKRLIDLEPDFNAYSLDA